MTKGNKGKNRANSGGKTKDQVERKRDERARRNALRKEREAKEYLENDENFVSFSNQLQALGYKIKDIKGDGLDYLCYITSFYACIIACISNILYDCHLNDLYLL